jgi:hypothetical protein
MVSYNKGQAAEGRKQKAESRKQAAGTEEPKN